ncbi:unnamed protein product [Cylindrotheca closterium]|uniref:Myb-like domain-containing protein n=1 Tax=Cylindrotheca closterium TaxID=2856 RepID=A0AAD2FAH2_9STRA|nr:unnamed protein product [Cylindrotheca closterium]
MTVTVQENRHKKETAGLDLCALRIRHPEIGTKRVFRKSKRSRSMSDLAMSHHSEPHQPQAAVSSNAVFNPLTVGEEQIAGVGGSVVDDLMSVYESMTQSKTPHPNHHQQSKPMVQHGQYDQYGSPDQDHQMQAPQPHIPQQQSPMVQQYNIPDHVYPQHVPAPQMQYQQPPQQVYGGYQNYQQHFAPPVQNYAPLDQQNQQHQQQMPKPEEEDDSDEMEEQPRKKRKGSSKAKGRKKGKNSDGRWSKRFTWPDDLHRDFVSAIFDVGLKHSSPSTIMEHMPKNPDITTERIKSHLQKYRLHRQKSKEDFMSSYEASLNKFQEKGLSNVKSLTNADAAAHLTYSATMDPTKVAVPPTLAPLPSQEVAARPAQPIVYSPNVNEALMLPQLTEAEKKSPIGASMGYLMGLFFSLKQQLAAQRSLSNTDKMNNHSALHTTTVVQKVADAEEVTRESPSHMHSGNSIASTACTEETTSSTHPATRNIEVNSHMKRDMQNQMAFQNKMRALKLQELNKIKKVGDGKDLPAAAAAAAGHPPQHGDDEADEGQVAGENGGHDGADGAQGGAMRSRGISIAASDDFWNSDVVDEQLFEFLMNH